MRASAAPIVEPVEPIVRPLGLAPLTAVDDESRAWLLRALVSGEQAL